MSGQVGPGAADGDAVEGVEEGWIGAGLIDVGRVEETVGEHPLAGGERRADDALDMVGAGGGEEHRLAVDAELLGHAGEQHACGSPRPSAYRRARGSATLVMPALLSRSASSRIWVDLPAPSPPSNVMNLPAMVVC